jgi:DNA-directed RNA polymerase subunit RPC12/RpoP
MGHKVFIRHTYIYKCSIKKCGGEWKINEALSLDKLTCPHCGKSDAVDYVMVDQREKYNRKFE